MLLWQREFENCAHSLAAHTYLHSNVFTLCFTSVCFNVFLHRVFFHHVFRHRVFSLCAPCLSPSLSTNRLRMMMRRIIKGDFVFDTDHPPWGEGEDVRDRDSVCSALRRLLQGVPGCLLWIVTPISISMTWAPCGVAMTLESLHEIAMLIRLQMSCAVKISRIICNESFISGFYVWHCQPCGRVLSRDGNIDEQGAGKWHVVAWSKRLLMEEKVPTS